MKYRVLHNTTYRYTAPVSLCHNLAHLQPRDTPHQTCLDTSLRVEPAASSIRTYEDYFGNKATHISIQSEHKELVVECVSEVETDEDMGSLNLDFGVSCGDALEQLAVAADDAILDAREFILPSPMVGSLQSVTDYSSPTFKNPQRPLVSAVSELVTRIHEDFQYESGFTTLTTPLAEVLQHRRGVCQDFAHLGIACVRAMGYPARYVSGYIETLPPPGQPKLVGADESHAWFSVFVPDEGWVDFDPTNNLLAQQRHITVAWGRDYSDVTPLRGVIFGGGSDHDLAVSVSMEQLPD